MRKQYHMRWIGRDRHIWDVHRLVRAAKALPVFQLPVSDVQEADENWWYQGPDDIPTPRSLAGHISLVQATDLAHPILLCAEGRLMDGMHRVVKALVEGRHTLPAIRFAVTPPPDFVNVDLGDLPYPDEDVT